MKRKREASTYRRSAWLKCVSRHPVAPRGSRQKCDANVSARTQPPVDLTFGQSTDMDTSTQTPPSSSVLHDLQRRTVTHARGTAERWWHGVVVIKQRSVSFTAVIHNLVTSTVNGLIHWPIAKSPKTTEIPEISCIVTSSNFRCVVKINCFRMQAPDEKTPRETQTLRAGCSKAEPKNFAPPQTPSRGRGTAKI